MIRIGVLAAAAALVLGASALVAVVTHGVSEGPDPSGGRGSRGLPATTDRAEPTSAPAPPGEVETVRAHPSPAVPYRAKRVGLVVRFLGPVMAPGHTLNENRYLWREERVGDWAYLPWRLQMNIFPGNRFEVLDDRPYDFSLGTRFYRVRRVQDGVTGYVTAATFFGEMVPEEMLLVAENRAFFEDQIIRLGDGRLLYTAHVPRDRAAVDRWLEDLRTRNRAALSQGQGNHIHPLYSASTALGSLLHALRHDEDGELVEQAKSAVAGFFEWYVVPEAVAIDKDSLAWPYRFEFVTNWGIRLRPPWYSSYANAAFAAVAALMHELTGEARYREISERAARFILVHGIYEVDGRPLPAEYIYDFRVMPNIRVLDGELITIRLLHLTAVLLRDVGLLDRVREFGEAISTELPYYTLPETGAPLFSAYFEERLPPTYGWYLWVNVQILANLMNDRQPLETARRWRGAVDPGDCERLAC
jgi:hypothetical protein